MLHRVVIEPEDIAVQLRRKKRRQKKDTLPLLYRNGKFFKVDGRSREGILLRDTANALLEQLGRKPNPAEKILIEKLAYLHLCTQYRDARILTGEVNYQEAAQYVPHINSFSRGVANLGLLGPLQLPRLDADDDEPEGSTQTSAPSAESALRKREMQTADD